MNIYMCASSQEIPRVIDCIGLIKAAIDVPMRVVSSWPYVVTQVGEANPVNATHQDRWKWAYKDMQEVALCNLLWVLMPKPGLVSAGAFWEFGFAKANNKIIIVSGPGQVHSVFTALATMQFDDDLSAFSYISDLASFGIQ